MRIARIREDRTACYHVVSRVVDKRMVFSDSEKERIRKTMRAVEGFTGVRVLTYALLDNHIHILLRVPEREPVCDRLLIRRLKCLYPRLLVREIARELRMLRGMGRYRTAERLKQSYTYRMYDLSEFMKTLKQRVTQSYNTRHGRKGTLWEERFKSILVENTRRTLWTVAAYIDLNAVRAGIVDDPKDYRFCGYGEALGGGDTARSGISAIMRSARANAEWVWASTHYRRLLHVSGEHDDEGTRRGIDPRRVQEVLQRGGKLRIAEVIHCRVRYFTDGVVLGRRIFVEDVFDRYRARFGVKRRTGARTMRGANWGNLYTARRLQLDPIKPPSTP